MKVKNESDVHKSNVIEDFYPIMREADENSASTSWSSDDLQNNFNLDDFHETNSKVTRKTRSAHKAHNEGRIKDKSDVLKSNTSGNLYSVKSKANRSLDGASSSGYDLQNSLNFDEGDKEEETRNHVAPVQKSKLQGNHTWREKRKRTSVGGNSKIRKLENYTVVIKWKNWYANEEEEEDIEPLRNKRTEKRAKQKLLENPADLVLKTEPLQDAASHVTSNSDGIPASLSKKNHGTKGEDGPSTSHVNSRKQSNIPVEDTTEAHRADLNDCINSCQNDPNASESGNHSATSQGLEHVSGDYRRAGIKCGDIDVIDLSDG